MKRLKTNLFNLIKVNRLIYFGWMLIIFSITQIKTANFPPGVADVNMDSETGAWSKSVIRGYSSAKATFILKKESNVDLKLSLLDPGLAISKILVY